MIKELEYHRPAELVEAVGLLSKYGESAKIYAGGTDLLLQMESGKYNPKHLISLGGVPRATEIYKGDGAIFLGPKTTHRSIEKSEIIKNELTALHEGSSQVGSVQIRNVATVAGNICNAVPSADTAAPLLVFDSIIVVYGKEGKREISLTEFFLGPGKNALNEGELLGQIKIPIPGEGTGSSYIKLARRKAMELALVGAATKIVYSPKDKRILKARIGLNTVAPTPMRATEAEKLLENKNLDREIIFEAANIAANECKPRTSWRSNAEYRREMVRNMVNESLYKSLVRAGVAWKEIE